MAFDTEPMEILTADEIWGAKDIETVDVPVPQWGYDRFGKPKGVRIKTFTKRQIDGMTARAKVKDRSGKEQTDNEMLEALLFCEGVIAPNFSVEDYERLKDKAGVAVGLILKAIVDANGLSDLAVQAASKSTAPESNGTLRVFSSTRIEDDAGGTALPDV
jgi:hypothetical protein